MFTFGLLTGRGRVKYWRGPYSKLKSQVKLLVFLNTYKPEPLNLVFLPKLQYPQEGENQRLDCQLLVENSPARRSRYDRKLVPLL